MISIMECNTCGKTFSLLSNRSRHGRAHKQTKVQCPCGRSFSRRDNLKRHQFLSATCRALEDAATQTVDDSPQSDHVLSVDNEDKPVKHIDDVRNIQTVEPSDDESDSDEEPVK